MLKFLDSNFQETTSEYGSVGEQQLVFCIVLNNEYWTYTKVLEDAYVCIYFIHLNIYFYFRENESGKSWILEDTSGEDVVYIFSKNQATK